ncbi:MAG: hypothetical protein WCK96_04395 [Methylococcales bacterium]
MKEAFNIYQLDSLIDEKTEIPLERALYKDIFSTACYLYLIGNIEASEKLCNTLFDYLGRKRGTYFSELMSSLCGNEKKYGMGISSHVEILNMFPNNNSMGGVPERTANTLHSLANSVCKIQPQSRKSVTICLKSLIDEKDEKKRREIVRGENWSSKSETVIYRIGYKDEALIKAMSAAGISLCQSWNSSWESIKEEYEQNKKVAKQNKVALPEKPEKPKKLFELARLNELKTDTLALYVGQSKDICKRMEWHLGVTNPSSYAMHLLRWLPDYGASILNMPIKIELWTVPPCEENIDLHERVAQALEDQLWDECQPLFGKRGAR